MNNPGQPARCPAARPPGLSSSDTFPPRWLKAKPHPDLGLGRDGKVSPDQGGLAEKDLKRPLFALH